MFRLVEYLSNVLETFNKNWNWNFILVEINLVWKYNWLLALRILIDAKKNFVFNSIKFSGCMND